MSGKASWRAQWPILAGFGVSSFGTGLVLPLTALYLSNILDAGNRGVAWYFALTAGAAFLANPFAGRIADRNGPLPVLFIALGFQTTGMLVLATSSSLGHACVAGAVIGVGNGSFFAVLMPTAKLIFGQDALGKLYSRDNMITNVCLAAAAAASGQLVTAWGETAFRICFAANGLSYTLLGLAVLAQLRVGPVPTGQTSVRVRPLAPWRPYLDVRFFALPVTQMCIIGFGVTQLEAVVPLVLHNEAGYSTRVVSLVLVANGLAVFALQTLVERYVSRIGEIGALQRAALTWLVTLPVLYLGAQLAGPAGVAVIVLYAVLFGLAETLVSPSMQPLVARSAPEGGIGIYAASISMAFSVGAAIGPALGIWVLGIGGVGGYLTLLAVILCLPLPLLAHHRRAMRSESAVVVAA